MAWSRKPRRDDGPYLHRESDPPEPPVNVRLRLTDGSVVPVQCMYEGRSANGIAHWKVIGTFPEYEVSHLTVESMPAQTAISISMPIDDED
jgi:hypothetical protein